MNARNKLNIAYFNGCVVVAGILGVVIQSWPVFVMALVVLVIGNIGAGSIRPK